MKLRPSNKQLKRISTAALLEEADQPRLLFSTTIVLTILIFFLLIWATFTDIQEKAITFGEVVPESGVHIIQHLEGGIIKKINIKNGDEVPEGTILMQLEKTGIQTELSQLRSRKLSLLLDAERLNSFISWQDPNLDYWLEILYERLPEMEHDLSSITTILQDEKRLLENQNKKRADQLQVIDEQISQRQQELQKIIDEQEVLENHIELLEQEGKIYDSLIGEGHISRKDYISAQKQFNKALGERKRLKTEVEKAKHALSEAIGRRERTLSDITEKATQDLDVINAKLLELEHSTDRLEDRLKRTTVKAPISGLVNGLELSAGSVIPPGGYLMEVVPTDKTMIVESRVNPLDIGHINAGDPVKVKVLTYDFARYGSVKGTLLNVSATTFEDENGNPYYKARISLESQFVGNDEKNRILPGMTVEASIITGEKSLMAYLLKPIRSSMESSFSER